MKRLFLIVAAATLLLPCISLGQTRTRTRTYTIHHRGGTQYVTYYSQKRTNHGRRTHGAYAHTYSGSSHPGSIGSPTWQRRQRSGRQTYTRTTRLKGRDYDHDGDYDSRDRWYQSHDYDRDGDYDTDDRRHGKNKVKKHGPKSMGRHDNGLHLGQRKHGKGD